MCKVASLLAALLRSRFAVDDRSDDDPIFARLADYCGQPMLALNNTTTVDEYKPFHWDFLNSVLFTITVVTTVGTSHSCRRSVLIFYGIVSDYQTFRERGCWNEYKNFPSVCRDTPVWALSFVTSCLFAYRMKRRPDDDSSTQKLSDRVGWV